MADMTEATPEELLEGHKTTGEPVDEDEVQRIVDAGLTTWEEWEDRGGGLCWHVVTFPEADD
jgi:hypothetical protein